MAPKTQQTFSISTILKKIKEKNEHKPKFGEKEAMLQQIQLQSQQLQQIYEYKKQLQELQETYEQQQLLQKQQSYDMPSEILNMLAQLQEEVRSLSKRVDSISNEKMNEQLNTSSGKEKNAYLRLYRKEINKLRDSLLEKNESGSVYMLEYTRINLQRKMDYIKELYLKLSIHFNEENEVREEFETIEEEYEKCDNSLAKKISSLKETNNSIELESIKIPFFNGNIHDWASFHDLYKQFIHENKQLSKVEKLLRLKTLLKGEAAKLIKHISTTETNYEGAWEIIKQRFDNKRIIFSSIIDKILDLKDINSNNLEDVKHLLNTTNECIHALKAMNIMQDDTNPIIARIILRKLDKNGILHYEQFTRKSKEIQQLTDVLQFLEQQYHVLEAVKRQKINSSPSSSKGIKTSMGQQTQCLYCFKHGHYTYDCRKLLALHVKERVSWASSSSVCLNCLSHKAEKKCISKSRCLKCNKAHHTIIHIDKPACLRNKIDKIHPPHWNTPARTKFPGISNTNKKEDRNDKRSARGNIPKTQHSPFKRASNYNTIHNKGETFNKSQHSRRNTSKLSLKKRSGAKRDEIAIRGKLKKEFHETIINKSKR